MNAPGSDPKKLLHRVLMGPAVLEKTPPWLLLVTLAALAIGVQAAWSGAHPFGQIAAIWLFYPLFDWVMLAGLHWTKRSFGPVKPSLLALAVARAGIAALVALSDSIWLALAVMTLISLLAWYTTWLELLAVEVTRLDLVVRQWPMGTPSLSLLHLSDLHLERIGLREERLTQMVRELSPDLICFSGDLLSLSYRSDPTAIAHARTVVGQWHAPLGVYAVTGSPLVDLPDAAEAILSNQADLRWLKDELVTLRSDSRTLTIVGLTCTHQPAVDGPRLVEILAEAAPDAPIVLLYHTPDLAHGAAAAGVDLQLSGHTHGGQIRLPFYGAVVTSSIYGKRYEKGEYQLPRSGRTPMVLYVSRGLGMEGGIAPRARLFSRPEITLWTLCGPTA